MTLSGLESTRARFLAFILRSGKEKEFLCRESDVIFVNTGTNEGIAFHSH